MCLGTLGFKDNQHSVSDIRKLFDDSRKSQKNIFTVSNISTPVMSNTDSDVVIRCKKKSSKVKGVLLHKKTKKHAMAAENMYSGNDILSGSSERHSASKMKILTDNDDDSTSLQTVKNMKFDNEIEGVEDKRLRDIILRMDRVLLAAMPSRNT